jgi:uncharacterized protein (TIGR01777 family)
MVRVAITGSSGLIGSALVEALQERGDDVIRFVRPESVNRDGRFIRWDPSRHLVDEHDIKQQSGFDAVVNLAGAGIGDRRWDSARKVEILDSRLRATSLLVEVLASLSHGTSSLATGSAVGIYGSRGDEVLVEDSSNGDDFLAVVCKRWEAASMVLADQGTAVATLRTGIVMSKRGGALRRQLPLFRLGVGGPLANGRQWLSPISLIDEVRAVLWIIDRQLSGPVNLVCPAPLTNNEFSKLLGKTLRRPAIMRTPELALKVVLGSQLTTQAVLASQRVVPKVLLESGFAFDNPDCLSVLSAALKGPSS